MCRKLFVSGRECKIFHRSRKETWVHRRLGESVAGAVSDFADNQRKVQVGEENFEIIICGNSARHNVYLFPYYN